jgi:hypothetical protein
MLSGMFTWLQHRVSAQRASTEWIDIPHATFCAIRLAQYGETARAAPVFWTAVPGGPFLYLAPTATYVSVHVRWWTDDAQQFAWTQAGYMPRMSTGQHVARGLAGACAAGLGAYVAKGGPAHARAAGAVLALGAWELACRVGHRNQLIAADRRALDDVVLVGPMTVDVDALQQQLLLVDYFGQGLFARQRRTAFSQHAARLSPRGHLPAKPLGSRSSS